MKYSLVVALLVTAGIDSTSTAFRGADFFLRQRHYGLILLVCLMILVHFILPIVICFGVAFFNFVRA